MELHKTIRENLDGKYVTIYEQHFHAGIEYAAQTGVHQIHIIGNPELKIGLKILSTLSPFIR